MMNWRTKVRAWGRLRGDTRGVAALEFALVVPLVIIVYAGGFEIAQASTVYRKLTDTTVQLANVTTQYTSVNQATIIPNIMGASSQIMAPYSTTPLSITLSAVTTDSKSVGTILWSKSGCASTTPCTVTPGLPVGSTVTMPANFASPSSFYIEVQTTYGYTPTIGAAFVSSIPMTDQIFMVPRQSTTIPCTDC